MKDDKERCETSMDDNKVVAIVGMAGAGKSEVTNFFKEQKWSEIYFGGVVLDEMDKLKLERNSTNEKKIKEKLRDEGGMGVLAKKLLPKIKKELEEDNVVLDGLYSWSEYKYLIENLNCDMKVIAVISDKDIRHERISNRKDRSFTFKEIEKRDFDEIEKLEKGGPIVNADYFVLNNGSFEELKIKISKIYTEL